jgi:hypothetical protein
VNAWYNENDPKAAAWLRELIKRTFMSSSLILLESTRCGPRRTPRQDAIALRKLKDVLEDTK